jgi:hypothetical protein
MSANPALLRASHIVPWADCADTQGLDVHNGLLLSALWDAAFDRGLISFADDGSVLASSQLSEPARKVLGLDNATPLAGLRDAHHANLALTVAETDSDVRRQSRFSATRRQGFLEYLLSSASLTDGHNRRALNKGRKRVDFWPPERRGLVLRTGLIGTKPKHRLGPIPQRAQRLSGPIPQSSSSGSLMTAGSSGSVSLSAAGGPDRHWPTDTRPLDSGLRRNPYLSGPGEIP